MVIYDIFSKPLTIKVDKARSSLGQKTIFEVLKKSLEDTNGRQHKDPGTIRNLRDSASQSIKVNIQLTIEISLNETIQLIQTYYLLII